MAADVVAQPANYWIYDSFNQLLSRIRTGSFFDNEYGYDRANQSTFISDLPEELLLQIFKYCTHSELAKCEMVCRSWMQTIRSAGTQLWHSANISYHLETKYTQSPFGPLTRLDTHQNLEQYVRYLLLMKPRLSLLSIDLNFMDERAFKAIEFLISSGSCANLKEVRTTWHTEDQKFDRISEEADYDRSCLHFNETLGLLVKHAPQVQILCTQFNFGFESLRQLDKFRNLVELDIVSFPRVSLLMPWHIEKILTKLTKLEAFRLEVTINCAPFSNALTLFTFASPTLRILDLSYCINLVVSSLDLPNLEGFRAINTKVYGQLRHQRDQIPCLFDTLSTGCPKLREINHVALTKEELALGLSSSRQSELGFCFCPKNHNSA